jgi:squalene-hopene/tetraprenyl-beta-curcumene cyclase
MRKKLAFTFLACLVSAAPAAGAEDLMDPGLYSAARRAVDLGLNYLRNQQAADGGVGQQVGLTCLSLQAFMESHRGYTEADGPFITHQVDYILARVQPDGSISESLGDTGYKTAVCLGALARTKNPKHEAVVAAARQFLVQHQFDEGEGYKQDHRYYGGFGYGGDQRPDLSNTYIALEGLKAASLDAADPAWQKALVFVNRNQNRSESNDQKWAGNDGGFVYRSGQNPPEFQIGQTASYGSMTAAGMLSLLYAGVDRNDPRIQAAYKWFGANYTLDTNPGTNKQHTLFYFYNAYAKVMRAYGEPTFTDAKGQKHNWRNELTQKLVSLQQKDGSWFNPTSKLWWEDKPQLVTTWSVLALENIIGDVKRPE